MFVSYRFFIFHLFFNYCRNKYLFKTFFFCIFQNTLSSLQSHFISYTYAQQSSFLHGLSKDEIIKISQFKDTVGRRSKRTPQSPTTTTSQRPTSPHFVPAGAAADFQLSIST